MEGENKDMKIKKLTALVLAGMLCLGMSVTTFAANSLTPEDAEAEAVDKDGNPITITATDLGAEAQEVVDKWEADPETLKADVEKAVEGTNITLKENAEYAVIGAFEYEGDLTPGSEITFNVSAMLPNGLEEGQTLYLMHGLADGSWVLVETTVKDGKATAQLDSLSPIAFVLASDGTPIVNPNPPVDPVDPADPNADDSITVDELVNLIVDRLKANNVTVNRTVVSSRVSPKTGE